MSAKIRPDDKLSTLPVEERQRLLVWLATLSYQQVCDLVAKPQPEGLGLETSTAALSRFYAKWGQEDLLATRQDMTSAATNLNAAIAAASNPDALEQATFNMLEQKAFLASLSPEPTLSTHQDVAEFMLRRSRLKLREQETRIKEKQLDLELRRVEVLEHKAQLCDAVERTTRDPTLTADQMQARYREIFGMPPLPKKPSATSHPGPDEVIPSQTSNLNS